MPKLAAITKKHDIKWNDIDEMDGAGFSDIEPGLYELVITGCVPHESDDYFEITWDVASGERKGNYASSQYPPSTRIYWREKALGFLKHRLHVLADWNNGFKSTVAFETDDWDQFIGKHFGAVVRRRLYTAGPNSKNPGADRQQMEIAAWLSPDDFKAGDFKESLLADNDQRERNDAAVMPASSSVASVANGTGATSVPATYQQGATVDLDDEDIPF